MLKYWVLSIGCLIYDTIKGGSVLLRIGISIPGKVKSALLPFPSPYCLLFLFFAIRILSGRFEIRPALTWGRIIWYHKLLLVRAGSCFYDTIKRDPDLARAGYLIPDEEKLLFVFLGLSIGFRRPRPPRSFLISFPAFSASLQPPPTSYKRRSGRRDPPALLLRMIFKALSLSYPW